MLIPTMLCEIVEQKLSRYSEGINIILYFKNFQVDEQI